MQNVATRKIQNSIQATGDRMSVTPQQFGMQVGQQVKRSAFNAAALGRVAGRAVDTASSYLGRQMRGAGIQAGRAMNRLSTAAKPLMNEAQEIGTTVSNKMNKALMGTPGRAAATGAAAGAAGVGLHMAGHQPAVQQVAPYMPMPRLQQQLLGGTGQGGVAGSNDPYSMTVGKQASMLSAVGNAAKTTAKTLARGVYHTPRSVKTLAAGAGGGYYLGRQHGAEVGEDKGREDAAKAVVELFKNKTPQKKASVLSVLGGLAGGGLGGLAGGAGGGILGALGGGALGGGPGAGLGLLAGGAAGLGAGAHMGGNIGANIGASFSKKKEKPENEEKEEKSEEKSEDSGDEEVKKSAAAVLAQLQNNAK